MITYDYNKLWIKVVYEKKFGGFTKLVEAITRLGLEFNDTNYITSKEAAVVTSCIEVTTYDKILILITLLITFSVSLSFLRF